MLSRRTAALVLLVLLVVAALAPLAALARPEAPCPVTPGKWRLAGPVPSGVSWAIDVSAYQRPALVPYPTLAAAGLCAVIVRAGSGLTPDPAAAEHLTRARAAGIPRTGTYWVPRSHLDPAAQADAYVRALARLRPTMAPVADLEGSWPPGTAGPFAQAFLDTIDRRARVPILSWVYTYPSFYRAQRLDRWLTGRPLWLAEYSSRLRTPSARSPPGTWPDLELWQYGGGPLPGAGAGLGEVDKNVYIP